MADGCATERELIVVLAKRDQAHLRRLLDALGCTDRPLRPANHGAGARLAIGSVALARQLRLHGIVPGRAGSWATVPEWMARSRDYWRGVVDGDGSIKFHPSDRIPSLEVVGAPGLMLQFASFLESVIDDGRPVRSYRHSQSTRVAMVKVGGRRAKRAVGALYPPGGEALARKRELAMAVMRWEPQVRSRYTWERWADGDEWVLRRGVDYDDGHRLWEAGRRKARSLGLRFVITSDGDSARIRFADGRC
jgi:hypothetical protein